MSESIQLDKFDEIRVRPVERYIVTRYSQEGQMSSSSVMGEFTNANQARVMAKALQKSIEGACLDCSGMPPEYPVGWE